MIGRAQDPIGQRRAIGPAVALAALTVLSAVTAGGAYAQTYQPPAASAGLLGRVDFSHAKPVDEGYRKQFVACDGLAPKKAGIDTFRGFKMPADYRCSTDPSRVKALLRLPDGGIYWDSKMALDVDGSWAAWSGKKWKNKKGQVIKTTDLCGTWLKWRSVPDGKDCQNPDAQVNPDRYPFAVIPIAGLKFTGNQSKKIGAEFRDKTGLAKGNMGVVIYRNKWSPAFIADGGPFMRLGEASSRVFENLGYSRCKRWNSDRTRCVGTGGSNYPYKNSGLRERVIFIFYPNSGQGLSPQNALARICEFAKNKLGLTGAAGCPG